MDVLIRDGCTMIATAVQRDVDGVPQGLHHASVRPTAPAAPSLRAMELAYDDNGGGASDPPFLFIHGWCCDRSYFAPQADHFGRHHRVVSVDQRGHGASPAAVDDDYSVPTLAADAAAVIEATALDRPVVVGHSLGGVVALVLAAERPDLVRAVVMVDPAPIVLSDELRARVPGILASLESLEGRRAFVAGMFAPSDDVDRKAQIVASMSSVSGEIAVQVLTELFGFDGSSALAACTVPIASIGSMAPANDPRALRRGCPHIQIGQTVGAGHFNQLEVPDQVNAMIEQLLRLLPATR
jgi:pimeloyl-ACP methyl ester carboxylesterase